ncbi:MAG TPA: hypothetical protein VFP56_10980 [Candidatus Limnocylindrales bacterium]|nr:hypothetical protein [Candidatus Limnocylindrales bacterium]
MTPDRARVILALAERSADGADPGRDAALDELLQAGDEVGQALDHFALADADAAERLAGSLSVYWQDSGRVDEGRRRTEALLAVPARSPTAARARALVVASELAFRQGDQDAARRHAAAAIEAGPAAGDTRAIGLAHINLARAAYREGDAAGIEREARQALDAAPGDVAIRRGAVHMLAWAAYEAGDRPLARWYFEESLALRLELGDRLGVATEEANLADLAAEDGDVPGAAARLAKALRVADELNSRYLVLNLLPSIAAVAARSGQDDDCARLLGATDAASLASGLLPDPGNWQAVMDEARDRLGDRFDVLRSEGNALSGAAAVDLALTVAERAAVAATG